MAILTIFSENIPWMHILFLFTCMLSMNYTYVGSESANSRFLNITDDHSALLSIKSLLMDPSGALETWGNKSLHYCNWHGVVCSKRHPKVVVQLNLDSLSLIGSISPQIANLTFLHRINLAYNNLFGFIPPEISLLSHLKYLNLENNSLEGNIPASLSLCYNLRYINLGHNMLDGDIPNGLGSLPKLFALVLRNNELDGTLAPMLGNTTILIHSIDISENKISGGIPQSLLNSSKLRFLNLSSNKIEGTLPVSLGSNLHTLYLKNNYLVGQIPSSLCANSSPRKYLVLSNNQLSGNIPSSLVNCSTKHLYLHENNLTGDLPPFSDSLLQYLSLYDNQLSGALPSSLGNNSNLLGLYLSQNSFTATIPESLGRLPSLLCLDLAKNFLTNEIPSSIYNLSSLVYLGVGENKLNGVIPENIGIALPNINFLYMNRNHFQGNIPTTLLNASGIKIIDLEDNILRGLIPPNLGRLKTLQRFEVGWNELEVHDWDFLSSLTNCTYLEELTLEAVRMISGTLPDFIGNFSSNLHKLQIGMNSLSGPIPPQIGNLVGLNRLHMDDCSFTGKIPPAIGKLQLVEFLHLGGNRLSGQVPFSVGNLTKLSEVHLEENELTGSIPSSFQNCTSLIFLNLSHNFFTAVPEMIFSLFSLSRALDLSNNLLSGPLPGEAGKLISLSLLDISKNNFSQEIPLALGQCVVLQSLNMSGNSFQGNIPPSFRSLTNLKKLDLSRNQLRGRIPDFFQDDDSLEFLNLAYNDFEGMVPERGLFANRTRFSIVGNMKLCGGLKELDLPPCKLRKNRFQFHMSKFLVIILFTVAFICLASSLVIIWWLRSKSNINPSSSNDKLKKITYCDIAAATNGFSPENLIGSGSSSSVYKGNLGFPEKLVAIKVFNVQHYSRSLKSFDAECKVLRKLRHRNLLKVITLCSSLDPKGNEFKALVFEYMHNGSLEDWLHPSINAPLGSRSLNLKQRISIAADVAFALNYLHHEQGNSPVVHCDIKPSNVLLDSNMTAHLSDFGLSLFLFESTSTVSLGELKGTLGYTPPESFASDDGGTLVFYLYWKAIAEYGVGNAISTQGDVYSFGVLVLEMLTGKKPTDHIFKDGLNICNLVRATYPDKITEVLDPVLLEGNNEANDTKTKLKYLDNPIIECILPLVEIGLSCCKDSPRERMEMKDVANKILAIKEISLEI